MNQQPASSEIRLLTFAALKYRNKKLEDLMLIPRFGNILFNLDSDY